MSNVWFTSDTHFLHKKVAELRGFETTQEHDEAIVANWNSLIRPADIVWHLGDVHLGKSDEGLEYVSRLNGNIQLVTGNHDAVWPAHKDARKHQRRWMEVFQSVQAFAKIKIEGETVLLSHFPYRGDHTDSDRDTQFRLRYEGAWLFHGHVHSPVRRTGGVMVHVGLDAWDLKPANSREVAGMMEKPFRGDWEWGCYQ